MTQYESLILPCIISITVALTWIIFLFMEASSKINKSFIVASYSIVFVSIAMFTISLFYIIQNITMEAPSKKWADPFILGWLFLYISFFIIIYDIYSVMKPQKVDKLKNLFFKRT